MASDSHSMKISTYNVHGVKNCNWDYLNAVVSSHDFTLVQEHWLHSSEFHIFSDKLCNVNYTCTSGMSDIEYIQGRPFGGCAVIWKTTLDWSVEPISCESSRLCAVKVTCSLNNFSFLLFTLYMPCDTERDECNVATFRSVLRELSDIATSLNVNFIICGGDFNCDLRRTRSLHTQALLSFIENEDFELSTRLSLSNVPFTFESKANQSRSLIDHFMFSLNMSNLVSSVRCDVSVDNLSDHNVLSMCVNMDVRNVIMHEANRIEGALWSAASADDIGTYRDTLNILLDEVHVPLNALNCTDAHCLTHAEDIALFHDSIVDACLLAANASLPERRTRRIIPGWNDEVRGVREQALLWHDIWKCNGCPRDGLLADLRRRTRAQYHRAIRQVRKRDEALRRERMAEAFIQPTRRDFWREIKKVQGGRVSCPTSVDDSVGEEDIANLFSEKYEALYRSVPYDRAQMEQLLQDLEVVIPGHAESDCHRIIASDVRDAVHKLKPNKSDGNRGMCTNHIINAPPKLLVVLSLLFNCMVRHACVPRDFALSTLIPIPKNRKKSLNSSDNYRAIALSNIFGKVLDHILLVRCAGSFSTSFYQFGFKAGHSTSMCTFAVNETIEWFTQNDSSVFCTLLDASRAFDRVEYMRLFQSLVDKGICPVVCRFLVNLYTSQAVRVKWCNTLSDPCTVLNGVKQGGVMSPILFSVYLDDLLSRLKNSGYGCCIDGTFLGAFAYADDLILLAPTLFATRCMLDVCETYAEDFNIMFNAQKSKLIVCSKARNDYVDIPNVSFMNGTIERVNQDKHLGNLIGNVAQNQITQAVINEFQRKVNMVKFHFKSLPPDVLYTLFKSHCMPLYGSQLLDLDSRAISGLYTAWRKAIRYIFSLPYRTHSRYLHLICNDFPIEFQLYKRFVKFFRSLCRSNNFVIVKCCSLVKEGSGSAVSNSLTRVSFLNKNVSRHYQP